MLSSTTASEAKTRRSALAAGLKGLVLLRSAAPVTRVVRDYAYEYRQDSQLLYFTGVASPGTAAILDLDENRFLLFAKRQAPEDLVWHDAEPSPEALAEAAGADAVFAPEELAAQLAILTQGGRKLHVLNDAAWAGVRASEELMAAVIALRAQKSESELDAMGEVMKVTARAHELAMSITVPGVTEQQIQAAVEAVFRAAGLGLAYLPIATCRGEVLHAKRPHRACPADSLFLLDAGAEGHNGYATDITRTWPVSGKFSEDQRRLYEIVLRSQEAGISRCEAGRSYTEVHEAAAREIIDGLRGMGLLRGSSDDIYAADAHAIFFPHGVGHFIGLDVHDLWDLPEDLVGYGDEAKRATETLGRRYLRLARRLEEGHVVTVEPGIYFIPAYLDSPELEQRFGEFVDFERARRFRNFGGIRIEDDIAIGASGPINLSAAIPKSVADIEARIGTRRDWLAALS